MILFLSLWRLSVSGQQIIRNPMQMDPVTTKVKVAAQNTLSSLDRMKTYLISNGFSYSTADKFYKKMRFSSSMNTVFHELKMNDWTLDQKEAQKKFQKSGLAGLIAVVKKALSRETIRKSVVVSVKKINKNFAVTITHVTGSTTSFATETKNTWKKFLWWKIQKKSNTYKRSLTGKEIEQINNAIHAKVYPLLQKYAKN